MDFLGSAAFSRAVQALDTKTGMLVCLKIIKVRMVERVLRLFDRQGSLGVQQTH